MWREVEPLATITVYIFPAGQEYGHLVKVDGSLPKATAMRMAIRALVARLVKRIN